MSLQNWVRSGWLRPHRSSKQEIADLFGVADRDIAACQTKGLIADWRLNIAYNAALQLATAALAVCILTDVALATIRLEPISPSVAFFVPVGTIAFELSCVIALVILIRSLVRRAVLASHLRQA